MPKYTLWLLMLLAMLLACPALAETEALPIPEAEAPRPLSIEDLTFAGIVFPEATLTDCMDVFGAPVSDAQDLRSGVVTLTYEAMRLEFLPGADGTLRLVAMLVQDDDIEGPRGLRIEDSRRSVEDRFGVSEEEDMDIYLLEQEAGEHYALKCTFSGDLLTEYLLYAI